MATPHLLKILPDLKHCPFHIGLPKVEVNLVNVGSWGFTAFKTVVSFSPHTGGHTYNTLKHYSLTLLIQVDISTIP